MIMSIRSEAASGRVFLCLKRTLDRSTACRSAGAHHDCVGAACVHVSRVTIEIAAGAVVVADRVYLVVKACQRQVEVLLDADVLRPSNHRIDELLASGDRRDHRRRLLQEAGACRPRPDLACPASSGLHTAVTSSAATVHRYAHACLGCSSDEC